MREDKPATPCYRLEDLLDQCEGDSFTLDDEWLNTPPEAEEVL